MAELNFGILDTQAPGRIAAMPQLAQEKQSQNAMQFMQVQQAMGQNELAKYQLSSARRTDEETNKLRALYGEASDISDPNFIRKVYAINPEKGIALDKAIAERAAKKLTQTKTEGEIQAQKYKFFVDRLSSLSQDPSDAGIDRFLKEAVGGGVMSVELASAKSAQLKSMGLPERQKAILGAGQSAKDALAASKPKFEEFSGGLHNVNEVDPNTGMPRFLSQRFAPLSTDAAIRSANAAGMKWNPETLQFENVGGGVPAQPGVAPAPRTPGAAPAQPGTPVTQATFPRITPQVQTQRNAEQIVLLNAELQKPENNNPEIQKALRAEIAKLSTSNPFAAPGGDPLRPAAVVNNLSGAQTVNAMNAPPAGAAPGSYSPKMLRDMALKGMQPDGKGGQTFIPGGEKDPVVEQRVATGKAVGAQIGKNNAVALEKLPNAITTGKELIRKLDEILGDANVVKGEIMYNTAPAKGFDSAFGPTGIIARAYPSSEAAGFQARVKEILGGAFLEAYETLRGAQGITDIEGKKATEARTRMGFDLSKTEFITAAREYRKTAAEALARSETRLKSLQGSGAPAGAPSLDAIFNTPRPQ